jgi:hypothetical protein
MYLRWESFEQDSWESSGTVSGSLIGYWTYDPILVEPLFAEWQVKSLAYEPVEQRKVLRISQVECTWYYRSLDKHIQLIQLPVEQDRNVERYILSSVEEWALSPMQILSLSLRETKEHEVHFTL